jgi:O-antigen ligase
MTPAVAYRTPQIILGLVLVAGPLLFGAVYPWAYGLLEIGVLAAFLLWLWRGPQSTKPGFKLSGWGLLCLMGFVVFAGLQLVPLPREMVKWLAEPIYQLWQLDFLPPDIARPRALLPLSLYPFATANLGILFLCYLLAFYLAANLSAPHGQAARPGALVLLIIFTGFAVAAVGIVQKGLEVKAIYGFFSPLKSKFFTGPYVNYNNFAGYLELAIPLGVSVVAFALTSRHKSSSSAASLAWLCGGAVIIMAAALFMSRSRGGIFTFSLITLGQVLVITALFGLRRMRGRFVVFGLVIIIILGVGAHMTDWSQTLPRFNALFHQDPAENLRWKLFKDILHMSGQVPLSGTGLGTFAVGYPPFKTIPRQGLFEHAHNDYLEILAETGWPGLLLFLGFVAWVLRRGVGALIRALSRRNRGDPELTRRALLLTGSLGGVLSLLVHGLVDFNLRIPANALTWFVLCGLTVGLSLRPETARPEPPAEPLEP